MEKEIKKLYVEASSRCNLACKMCFRHSWIDEGYGDLDPAVFERLMDDPALSSTETVFFGGMGEPLVHPGIIDMVRQASERGMKTELITNGTLLDQDCCEALLSAGLKRLWLSVDDIYENYEKIQRGGDFGKVLRHLKCFNELRRGTDVRLGMTAVLMRDNIANLPGVKDFALQYEADDMNFSHMIPNRPEDEAQTLWFLCDDSSFSTKEYLITPLIPDQPYEPKPDPDAKRQIPMFAFSKYFKRSLIPDEEDPENAELFSWKGAPAVRRMNYCRFIEEGHCFVRWDGDVAPCMGLLHSSFTYLNGQKRTVWRQSYGNLSGQSLSDIWNSEEYRSFRERVHSFEYSPCYLCSGCERREENRIDCMDNEGPVCGACLWGQGFISCP